MDMMDIEKAVSEELNTWQVQTKCDNVTRMKIQPAVWFKHYHNALVDELQKSGISIEKAAYTMPTEDLP